MTELQELQSLLERVEKAAGPDREIDAAAFQGFDPDFPEGALQMHAGFIDPANFATGPYTSVKAPRYTASIDAALALVERVLPGSLWHVNRPAEWKGKTKKRRGVLVPAFEGYISLGTIGNADYVSGSAMGHNPALAILAALLKAMIAQKQGTPYTVGDPEGRKGEE